jgi:hypothetical protein
VGLPGLSTYPLINVIYAVIHINSSTNCAVTAALNEFLTWFTPFLYPPFLQGPIKVIYIRYPFFFVCRRCRIFQSPVASSTAQSIGYFSLPPTIYTVDLNRLVTSLKCHGSLLLSSYAVVLGGGSKQSGALFDLLVSEYSTNFAAVQMSYTRV